MKRFKKLDKKKRMILISSIGIVLLIAVVLVYRTYAIYQEMQNFDVIKGNVTSQDYDLKFAFLLEDENGNKTYVNEMPTERKYNVTISCNNNATGVWDYESWGPLINNLNKIRTKCNITFKTSKPLQSYGIQEELTDNGNGLYRVNHENAHIDYSDVYDDVEAMKKTEYRYAGSNPNNYASFNNELWRIIGLVNTKEGQRLKIIRNESIGVFSWDSSESAINKGWGVNEWSQAKLMKTLNEGAYYNRTTGTCYNGENNQTINCNFSETGLTNDAKEMIDTITWNTGSQYTWISTITNGLVKHYYDFERSNANSKRCIGVACTDTIARTVTWLGKVGLMYASDYGYATSGGASESRNQCLNLVLYNEWNEETNSNCKDNSWLYKNSNQWTITSIAAGYNADLVQAILQEGNNYYNGAYNALNVFPVVYLKNSIKITSGLGSINNPYKLTFS